MTLHRRRFLSLAGAAARALTAPRMARAEGATPSLLLLDSAGAARMRDFAKGDRRAAIDRLAAEALAASPGALPGIVLPALASRPGRTTT